LTHSLAVASVAASVTLVAQTPPAQRVKEVDTGTVTAIVVDVVVRDHDGNPVLGLNEQDFELYEDRVRQDVGSFNSVAKGAPASSPATPASAAGADSAPTPASPAAAPEVVALVFDRMSPEARSLAHKAALGYVGDGKVANNIVAVFGIDLSLIFYQPFTRDADLLRKGIEAAGARSTSQYGSTAEQQRASAEQAARSASQVNNIGAQAGPGSSGQAAAGPNTDLEFATMQLRMLESFQSLERDQQGYATSNALVAIVSAMRATPGRKSVVFFSEGLSIPPNVQSQFISVIDAANRANVAIYPMDAAGLRTESTLKETSEGVAAAGQRTLNRNPTDNATDQPMMFALERNEALLRADPQSGLGTLANQTGGFLIANSNDLRGGFSRIDTDMRNYYVLTYVPKNTSFDGRFREIDVKVRRPGLRVRARKGYFAVRVPAGAPVLANEAPALAALEQTPLPNAFPVRAMALRFPEASRPGFVTVIVRVPATSVTFQPAEDKKTYTSDFLVLVRFKDDVGQVLEKMSQRYQINGPIEQIDNAKLGDVIFYRQPVLAPRVYTMETVVHDALAKKSTVRVSTVEVSDVDASALRLSSLVAIRKVEKVPESERVPGSPLYVGDQLLYPNMGEPISKAAAKELPFYFVAYPAAGANEPTATIELYGNGQRLAEAPLPLTKADDGGRMAQVSRIPIDGLAPGTYELRVTVKQGPQLASRSLPFRVTP
jgi:VWFA-related protein